MTFNPMGDRDDVQIVSADPAAVVEAIDFNPMADDLEVAASAPSRHLVSYSEAYRAGGEFVLVIGPESTARTMLDVVSVPVAREAELANKPSGIYRVFDGDGGKKITPWESSADIQPAKQAVTPQWQRVCTPAGCQWIQVK